jgi:prepilin-type N-terminal cleavage/methylation domain-containing protein
MSTPNRGFTLVELLVVIVVIGMLVALLLPAVLSSRESSRQAACMTNMKTIGTAIFAYEAEKGRLPGFINPPMVGNANVSWPMAILPYMGRLDIVSYARSNGSWPTPVYIKDFVCPNDPQKGTVAADLSYVVPSGVASVGATPTSPYFFVDRHQATSTSGFQGLSSQILNPAQTVMIGERTALESDTTHNPNQLWHAGDTAAGTQGTWMCTAQNGLAFNFPSSGTAPLALTASSGLTSSHPGILIVGFFDGSAARLADDSSTTLNSSGLATWVQ